MAGQRTVRSDRVTSTQTNRVVPNPSTTASSSSRSPNGLRKCGGPDASHRTLISASRGSAPSPYDGKGLLACFTFRSTRLASRRVPAHRPPALFPGPRFSARCCCSVEVRPEPAELRHRGFRALPLSFCGGRLSSAPISNSKAATGRCCRAISIGDWIGRRKVRSASSWDKSRPSTRRACSAAPCLRVLLRL